MRITQQTRYDWLTLLAFLTFATQALVSWAPENTYPRPMGIKPGYSEVGDTIETWLPAETNLNQVRKERGL